MTTSEPSRLDRIERILENVAEQQQLFSVRLEETRQLVTATAAIADSNARAIAAHSEELRTSITAHREEFRGSIADVVDMIAENARSSAENSAQVQVLIGESRENSKQHQSFLERFDRILGEIRALWQRVLG